MDRGFPNLVEKTRSMKITDLYGHELERKPALFLPRGLDDSYFEHARSAGVATRYMDERDYSKYIVGAGMIAGQMNDGNGQTRRDFLRKAGSGLAGIAAVHYLGKFAFGQNAPATIKVSGEPTTRDPVEYYGIAIPTGLDGTDKITEEVQMVEKFHDSEVFVPQTNDYLDGLAHEYWMNGLISRKQGCGSATTFRWQELPINYFIENEANAPAGYVDATLQAAEAWNSRGVAFFKKGNSDPTQGNGVGIKVWYRSGPTGVGVISEVQCKYPTQADIAIKNAFPNDPLNKIVIAHELGHALMFGIGAGTVHSPFPQHNMRNGPSKMPTEFEKQDVWVLYSLRNGTNLDYYAFKRHF